MSFITHEAARQQGPAVRLAFAANPDTLYKCLISIKRYMYTDKPKDLILAQLRDAIHVLDLDQARATVSAT